MKLKSIIGVSLLLLALMATPLLSLAQDEDEELEVDTSEWVEFSSEDEVFTLLYPPDWFVGSDEEPGNILVVNSEALLEKLVESPESPAEPGDKVVNVFGLLPLDFVGLMGIELDEEATTEDLISAMATVFEEEAASSEEDDTEFGEVEVREVGDEVEIGVIEISSETAEFEGYFFAYLPEEDVLALGFYAAYLGEFDEEFQATAITILANLQVNVTGDELMDG